MIVLGRYLCPSVLHLGLNLSAAGTIVAQVLQRSKCILNKISYHLILMNFFLNVGHFSGSCLFRGQKIGMRDCLRKSGRLVNRGYTKAMTITILQIVIDGIVHWVFCFRSRFLPIFCLASSGHYKENVQVKCENEVGSRETKEMFYALKKSRESAGLMRK